MGCTAMQGTPLYWFMDGEKCPIFSSDQSASGSAGCYILPVNARAFDNGGIVLIYAKS